MKDSLYVMRSEIGDDCFYIVLFSVLEQTHCTHM